MGEKILCALDFRRILKNKFEGGREIDTPFRIYQSELARDKRLSVSIVAQIDNPSVHANKRTGLIHKNVILLRHELYLEPSVRVPRRRIHEAFDRLADVWA